MASTSTLCSTASSSSSFSHPSRSSLSMQKMRPSRPAAPPTPSIASLPSLAHSLSAFPTMTAVTKDMVHYGTLGRTKGVSEAKLNLALQKTRQRQEASPLMSIPQLSTNVVRPSCVDDGAPLTISRKHRPNRAS